MKIVNRITPHVLDETGNLVAVFTGPDAQANAERFVNPPVVKMATMILVRDSNVEYCRCESGFFNMQGRGCDCALGQCKKGHID